MPDFFCSLWFRNAMIYTLLFLVVAALAGVLTYRSVEVDLHRSVLAAVATDQSNMMTEFAAGGLPALKEAVQERLSETSGAERFYVLQSQSMSVLLGNMVEFPSTATFDGTTDVKGKPVHILGTAVTFSGGSLFVGRSVASLDATLATLKESFILASIGLFFVALGLGTLLGLHSEWRIRSMAREMRSVIDSGMKSRLTTSTQKNEYDRLSSDINIMLERLSHLVEGIRHVSTNIAHDLRAPLFRLRQKLETLVTKNSSGDCLESKSIVGSLGEVDAMNQTCEALLRIAEIEDGSKRQAFMRVDLSALMIEIEDLYSSMTEAEGGKLICDFEYGVRVWGDRDLLLQMIANLVENALRHGATGGVVTLGLRTIDQQALLSVSDAGPGIPPSEHEKVFRRLYRGDSSRSTSGQGLGLSLVAAVVELHQADIKLLDNHPGLKVEVKMPVYTGNEAGEK